MRLIRYYILFSLFIFVVFTQNTKELGSINDNYMMGEDGLIRMNINIIGHVKSPGIYLVYDGIDLMSALSMAGGYLEGANLKNIIIYHSDGTSTKVNLNNYLRDNKILNDFKPHDTIIIEQKSISRFLTSTNLPTIFLSILNVLLTLDRTD